MTEPNWKTLCAEPLAQEAYVAFVQICKGGSDDAGTYEADEALVRRALKRLDRLESAALAQPEPPVEEDVAAIPCNCWLDDESPCPSPCVFDDSREEVNDCKYASMIQSANKKKTDCKYYRAAQPEPKPLTVQEINDLPEHRENCIYESGSDEILLDGHFTRAQLRQLADSIPTSRSENV